MEPDFYIVPKDNCIYLYLNAFLSIFQTLQICMLQPNYCYISRSVKHIANTFSIRTFMLNQPSHCFVEVSQLDKKNFRNSKTYDYSFVRLLIGTKNENNEIKYIDGIYKKDRNVFLELFLSPGLYYLIILAEWTNSNYEMIVNYYGEEPTFIDRLIFSNNKFLYERIMGDLALQKGEKINVKSEFVCLYFYVSIKDSIILEYLTNNSYNKVATMKRDYRGLLNKEKKLNTTGRLLLLKKRRKGKEECANLN